MAPTRKQTKPQMSSWESKHSVQAIIEQEKAKDVVISSEVDMNSQQYYSLQSDLPRVDPLTSTSHVLAQPSLCQQIWLQYCNTFNFFQRMDSLGDEIRSRGLPTALRLSSCKSKSTQSPPRRNKVFHKHQFKNISPTKDDRGRVISKPGPNEVQKSPIAKETLDFTRLRQYYRKKASSRKNKTIEGYDMIMIDVPADDSVSNVVASAGQGTSAEATMALILTFFQDTTQPRGVKRCREEAPCGNDRAKKPKLDKSVPSYLLNVDGLVDIISYKGIFPFSSAQHYEARLGRAKHDGFPNVVADGEPSIVEDEAALEPQADAEIDDALAAMVDIVTEELAYLSIKQPSNEEPTEPEMEVEADPASIPPIELVSETSASSRTASSSPALTDCNHQTPATSVTEASSVQDISSSEIDENITSDQANSEDIPPQNQPSTSAGTQALPTAVPQQSQDTLIGHDMDYVRKCTNTFVPEEYRALALQIAQDCQSVDYTNRPWLEDFQNPHEILLLSSFLQTGPCFLWFGKACIYLELPKKQKMRLRQKLRDLMSSNDDAWIDLLTTVFQLGLHPKDLLPDHSEYKSVLFADEPELNNKQLDDEFMRTSYGIQLPFEHEIIPRPEQRFIQTTDTIAHGCLDVLQDMTEDWLEDGKEIGGGQLSLRLDTIRTAMQRSGITTDDYREFDSFFLWLDGTKLAKSSQEFYRFTILLKQFALFRYPRSMKYGITTELPVEALCDREDSDNYSDYD